MPQHRGQVVVAHCPDLRLVMGNRWMLAVRATAEENDHGEKTTTSSRIQVEKGKGLSVFVRPDESRKQIIIYFNY